MAEYGGAPPPDGSPSPYNSDSADEGDDGAPLFLTLAQQAAATKSNPLHAASVAAQGLGLASDPPHASRTTVATFRSSVDDVPHDVPSEASVASLSPPGTAVSQSNVSGLDRADAGARIHALGRKARDLQAKANAEHARNAKLVTKVGELEYTILGLEREVSRRKRVEVKLQARIDELTSGNPALAAPKPVVPPDHVSEADVAKVHEYRSEIQQLRQQLRKAHKALEREVGDGVPLARVLASDAGWQGRAEQVTLLKAKLAEAQAQRRQANGSGSAGSESGVTSPRGSVASSLASTRRSSQDADPRARNNLRRLERDRRAQLEETQSRLTAAEEEQTALKAKYDAVRARNSTLGKESKTLRARIKEAEDTLASQTAELERLHQERETLTAELERARAATRTTAPRVARAADSGPSPAEAQLLDALERLTALADDRQRQIDVLRRELQQQSTHGAPRPVSRTASVRSAEGSRHAPLPPIPPSRGGGTRPASRAASADDASRVALLPVAPPPLAPPTANTVRRTTSDDTETQALLSAAELERDRLAEHNTKLQRRLEDLESQLARLRVSRSQNQGQGQGQALMSPPPAASADALEARLLIEREEADALRARLETTLAHKEEEIALLRTMMRETRRVFSEAVAKARNSASSGK